MRTLSVFVVYCVAAACGTVPICNLLYKPVCGANNQVSSDCFLRNAATNEECYVEVNETEGDSIPETPILVVSVNHGDLLETNRFSYKIIENSFGADKFTMVTNSDGTVSLKIAKGLDFEDLHQRYGFNITIQVSDHAGGPSETSHVAYAKVRVRRRDINDNQPEFNESNIEVLMPENAEIGTYLATFHASDPDQGGKSQVRYAIDRASDRKRQFSIDQNGVVRIQRQLDREVASRHLVSILAIDDGTPPRTATATLNVVVIDINDNAPRFIMDYRPVIPEYAPPMRVVEILAVDNDDGSKGHGPPFTFRLDGNASAVIQDSFAVRYDAAGGNGDGMATVVSRVKFDREIVKEYHIPIIISDSGNPSMTGTSTLTVIIGDVNDNRMYPGNKSIFIYNFQGKTPPINIGRVHIEDVDDWDLPDKTFYWKQGVPHEHFGLDSETGMITMVNVTSDGTYFLNFLVYDRMHAQEVEANVTVTVKGIPEEAIYNSGSVRISGISAEDFISIWNWKNSTQVKSKYQKFKEVISRVTNTNIDNVDVFSVIEKQDRPPITDVRFSVHGSHYFKSSFLNGNVALNLDLIQVEVGINITMVGIDECFENEDCEYSSCTNILKVEHPVLLNANRTSFVGVNTWVHPVCTCDGRDFTEIEWCRTRPAPCHNHTRCVDSDPGVSSNQLETEDNASGCECREGFDGPQCQQRTRKFSGREWAWFPPLQKCENSHLSLEFLTNCVNGLLMYNGPITNPDPEAVAVQDFISLELEGGYPRLLIDFGSGTTEVSVHTPNSLDDGEWHRIDVFWDRDNVRIVVDNCTGIDSSPEDGGPPKSDRSMCEGRSTKLFDEFLNVNTPLQLGGVHHKPLSYKWQYQHMRGGFKGVIQNLIYNNDMYDLSHDS